MRFAAAAIVASSAVAYAQTPVPTSTYAVTQTHSIVDCGDDVADCPAKTEAPEVPEGYTASTVYEEHVHTIIDCGPEVPDCPAHSSIIVTETIPVSTTICPIVPTDYPVAPPPHGNGTIPEKLLAHLLARPLDQPRLQAAFLDI